MATHRDHIAVHEAGRAVAAHLIYGKGYLVKVKIGKDYGETVGREESCFYRPRLVWISGERWPATGTVDDRAAFSAFAVQALAGIAADFLIHQTDARFQTAAKHIEKLNTKMGKLGWEPLRISPEEVVTIPPYSGWFLEGLKILEENQEALGDVVAELGKRDNIGGPELSVSTLRDALGRDSDHVT